MDHQKSQRSNNSKNQSSTVRFGAKFRFILSVKVRSGVRCKVSVWFQSKVRLVFW